MKRSRPTKSQLSLGLPKPKKRYSWGGKRKGAGRKPVGNRAGTPHRQRPRFARTLPVHVTLRMKKGVCNLRRNKAFRAVEKALYRCGERGWVKVIEFSVMGNHVHVLLEAKNGEGLMAAMKGLSVRLARALNGLMGSHGQVIGDRYHAHVLKTPTEVKNASHYIRHNYKKHQAEMGVTVSITFVDPFSSWGNECSLQFEPPSTWLGRQRC